MILKLKNHLKIRSIWVLVLVLVFSCLIISGIYLYQKIGKPLPSSEIAIELKDIQGNLRAALVKTKKQVNVYDLEVGPKSILARTSQIKFEKLKDPPEKVSFLIDKGERLKEVIVQNQKLKPKLTTDFIISEEDLSFEKATIKLKRYDKTNAVLTCSAWNKEENRCNTDWEILDIPLSQSRNFVTFEVKHTSAYVGAYLEIIDVQTNLFVGDIWTARFRAYGQADLTIKPINGTEYPRDLEFLGFYCGEEKIDDVFDGQKVFIPDYSCENKISRIENRALTLGKHVLEFRFGDDVKTASNWAESIYDFSTGAGTDKWAYEKGNIQPTSPTDHESEAASGDYTAISSSNDSRWTTGLADPDEYDSQIYTFIVDEGVEYISQIGVEWEGYGEIESGYLTYLKIWNENTSSWEQLDSNDFASETDATLSGSKTTNISNYIDSNSKIHILATTQKPPPKRVFIISTDNRFPDGNFGGLSGADAKCQTLADAAELGGNWTAWLSDNSTDAKDRVTHSNSGYVLVDEITKVADNWADLTDGSIDHVIMMDETGNTAGFGSNYAWTGTDTSGTKVTNKNCNNWTSNSSDVRGWIGKFYVSTALWTDWQDLGCNWSKWMYCFED